MATPAPGKTDRKLLDLIRKDGRITNLELAELVASPQFNLKPSSSQAWSARTVPVAVTSSVS
jgi:hypothetical protein